MPLPLLSLILLLATTLASALPQTQLYNNLTDTADNDLGAPLLCRPGPSWLGSHTPPLSCAGALQALTRREAQTYGSRFVIFTGHDTRMVDHILVPLYYPVGNCVLSVSLRQTLGAVDVQVHNTVPQGLAGSDMDTFNEIVTLALTLALTLMRRCKFGGENNGAGWAIAGHGHSLAVALWGVGSEIDRTVRRKSAGGAAIV
ncbi:MAG: hypothetical protein LQ342_005966 [Letrouitia transgressa]|nr:MAG: hypothetical protein LQ342_005966 [Letrouitia transgressa]